jgi:hypothetical protein
MKQYLLFLAPFRGRIVLLSLLTGGILGIGSCESSILPPSYRAELPPLPPEWEELLGAAHWRLEWIDTQGAIRSLETGGVREMDLDLIETWTNPVLAYPFWPDRNIAPGIFRPAGALYPFDVREGRISLSWQGGVEAWFYHCLREAPARSPGETGKRRPELFDWPRFRTILENPALDAGAAADLWRPDWREIADKTLQSGFDQKRIKPRAMEELPVTIPWTGLYLGSSPFAAGVYWEKDKTAVFSVDGAVDTYVCAGGILRCTRGAWIPIPAVAARD